MFENSVRILGRITAEPEMRAAGENKVLNFRVAVNRSTRKDHPEADFFSCVAWNKTAEFICNYFGKGDKIGVEGRLQTKSYEDKNGNKRDVVEIIAENISFIEKRKDKVTDGNKEDSPRKNLRETLSKGRVEEEVVDDDDEDEDFPF